MQEVTVDLIPEHVQPMSQKPAMPLQGGSIPLFQVAGISVSLHWSWLVVAYFEISSRADSYSSMGWNIAEYLALFGIVLMHEFGHALACRQVGGRADSIVLWPLGGVAFVAPPPRPGAVLWSIAAGPLVNVALVPVTVVVWAYGEQAGWPADFPNAAHFVEALAVMNGLLLVFNLMPVYPLDGGQILQALLWFVIGRVRSLQIVSVIGFIGAVGLILFALNEGSWWMGVIAVFIAIQAVSGYQQANVLRSRLEAPRHLELACPSCGIPPLRGNFWECAGCKLRFDPFVYHAQCPQCAAQFPETGCPECGQRHPIDQWHPLVLPVNPQPIPGSNEVRP